jgi:hypothetical protein
MEEVWQFLSQKRRAFVEGRDLSDEALTQTYRTQRESMPSRSSIIA